MVSCRQTLNTLATTYEISHCNDVLVNCACLQCDAVLLLT